MPSGIADVQLRALFEHMMDGVLFSSPAGDILAANPAACALLCATEDEIVASGRHALMDTTDPRWGPLLAERRLTGKAHGIARMRRPTGEVFECEMSSAIFTMEDGELRACVVLRDVSDAVRVVTELRRAERLWRVTIDGAPTGIALVRLDGHWLHVNPALCEALGYTETELRACTFQDITHPEDLDADLDLVGQLVDGAIESYSLDKRYFRKDGSVMWARIDVGLVTNDYDEPVHFVVHVQDITAQRRESEELADRATRDVLTRLLNREAFGDAVAVVPPSEAIAVAFVDLDGFKAVNDEHGHAVGDELLVAVAGRLRGQVRPRDAVARLGGDEFVVLFREVAAGGRLDRVAQRLVTALAAPYHLSTVTTIITASVGVTIAGDVRDAESLVAAADTAMYVAKRGGRNTYCIQ